MEREKISKIIIVSAVCLSFVLNSIFFGWEATRRSADELEQINKSRTFQKDEKERCFDAGGFPKDTGVGVECVAPTTHYQLNK